MDALDLGLIGLVAVLSTALALMLLARLRDIRTVHTESAKLEAARLRIAQLEHTPTERAPAPARRFSRV